MAGGGGGGNATAAAGHVAVVCRQTGDGRDSQVWHCHSEFKFYKKILVKIMIKLYFLFGKIKDG